MTEQLREAMRLKPYQLSVLENMAKYAEHYCPNNHILELLYDYNRNMACEERIRYVVGEQGVHNYSSYTERISRPFQKLFEAYWNRIENVITNIRSAGDASSNDPILIQKQKLSKRKPNQIMSPSKNQPGSIPVVAPSDTLMNPHTGIQQEQSVQNQVDQRPNNQENPSDTISHVADSNNEGDDRPKPSE